ncbi:MAG TPA: TIGR03435 family protein [Candidatus Limnocylindrales bacterium]|nr:TIGR03435 family protein [Candidatus Limnocylindrales bacterium]
MPTCNRNWRLAGAFLALLSAGFGQQIADELLGFDVVSVKPSLGDAGSGRGRKGAAPFAIEPTQLSARHLTLKGLISRAYAVDESLVRGGPGWLDSDRYDIDATIEKAASREQMLAMLQSVLADRFLLKLHRETKLVPQYVLVVGKSGPKFGPNFHTAEAAAQDGLRNYTMARLAYFLFDNRDWWDPEAGPVLDETGLGGSYDLILNMRSRKDWLANFEQDTGLKVELRRISSELVVVDSARKPAAN